MKLLIFSTGNFYLDDEKSLKTMEFFKKLGVIFEERLSSCWPDHKYYVISSKEIELESLDLLKDCPEQIIIRTDGEIEIYNDWRE